MRFPLLRDRRVLIALLTLVYVLSFTPALMRAQPAGAGLVAQATLLVGAFTYAWAFFFVLRASRLLFLFAVPVLFAVSAAIAYYIWQFRFEFSYQQLAVVTEVEWKTASAFITGKLVLLVVAETIAGALLAAYCVRNERPDPRNHRITLIMLVLLVCVFTLESGRVAQRYFPYNFFFASGQFLQEKLQFADGGPVHQLQLLREDKEPVTVVLVVGESVRAANWGLNGYARQTTPKLAARRDVVNFAKVHSCYPLTRVAVPCILTGASPETETPAGPSLIAAFNTLGFHTASIDMHGMGSSIFGGPVSSILAQSRQPLSFNSGYGHANNVDDAGVEALRGIEKAQDGNLFVFLHTFGSHWPFDTRYPEAFRKFTPVCNPESPRLIGLGIDMAECDRDGLINAYDNSILYADAILDAVIQSVADRPALVVFTSDHGQSLGEDGLFLHGHPQAAMEREVPLVFWASPQLQARYPRLLGALQRKKDSAVAHDAIFHTVLDCIGARGASVDPKRSLCR